MATPATSHRPPTSIPFYSNVATMPAQCLQDAANLIGTAGDARLSGKYGCYQQGNSVMIAPPANTFGTASRNEFRGPDYIDWDFSLFKNIKFTERLTAQFRAEAYNILNHKILYQGTTNPNSHRHRSAALARRPIRPRPTPCSDSEAPVTFNSA